MTECLLQQQIDRRRWY